YYHWNARLPSGKSGRHIIYTVWERSDSPETFYSCSDVVFDGGDGEVTGIGPGSGTTRAALRAVSRTIDALTFLLALGPRGDGDVGAGRPVQRRLVVHRGPLRLLLRRGGGRAGDDQRAVLLLLGRHVHPQQLRRLRRG